MLSVHVSKGCRDHDTSSNTCSRANMLMSVVEPPELLEANTSHAWVCLSSCADRPILLVMHTLAVCADGRC